MRDGSGRFVEWRVTGEHADPRWREEMPPYDFVWSARTTPHLGADNAAIEAAARRFATMARDRGSLTDVRLRRRTVVISHWTDDA